MYNAKIEMTYAIVWAWWSSRGSNAPAFIKAKRPDSNRQPPSMSGARPIELLFYAFIMMDGT